MNSPDFWRWGNGLCPDHRGYPATFRQCANPVGGEYLEIPSIAGIHNHRYRYWQKGGEVGLTAFDLIEKKRVGLLISFSVASQCDPWYLLFSQLPYLVKKIITTTKE